MEQLAEAVERFGDAALRAKQAGYDGIELHAAHSYLLLGSFLSPIRNHRQDQFGGKKLETRMKLLLEVLANIRQKVGEDFPITLRIAGYERDPGGRTVDETQRMIQPQPFDTLNEAWPLVRSEPGKANLMSPMM